MRSSTYRMCFCCSKSQVVPTAKARTESISMQYHQNIIHAHRPWMSRTLTQPNPPQGPGSGHARMMCIESATAITRLLQLYEGQFAFRRMSIQGVGITCSAALLLMFAAVTNYQHKGTDDMGLHLNTCFRALEEFGAAWESAKRVREFLVLLQRQWQREAWTTREQRASDTTRTSGDTLPRKRTRTPSLDCQHRNSPDHQGLSPLRLPRGICSTVETATAERSIDLDWIFTDDTFEIS